MVVKDFTKRRIAPLQRHSEPMWTYTGPKDPMRLCGDHFAPEVLDGIMETLFMTADIPEPVHNAAHPLFNYPAETALELRQGFPVFDEWGIVPAGHQGPRGNPWAADLEELEESSESEEVEGSGEEAGPSRRAETSGSRASSSRSAAPEAEPEVISSGSEEEPPRRAPSRSAVEEEEEERRAREGRREPRTKAVHDKDAAASQSAPGEGAEAPQGGARAHTSKPTKAKRRVWRMADA